MNTTWYFAYGSNMQTATFRGRRGIEFQRAMPARALGWRIVFDKPPLIPLGESYANILAEREASVFGVLYEIRPDDLEHIELTEGVPIGSYKRVDIPVVALAPKGLQVVAATLVSDAHDPSLRPSDRYLGCLIAGAEEHGLPAEYVAYLRGVPCVAESEAAARFRPLLDEAISRRNRSR